MRKADMVNNIASALETRRITPQKRQEEQNQSKKLGSSKEDKPSRKAQTSSKEIAENTGVSKSDVILVLEWFFHEVKESLIKGEPVYVRGFGSFMLKKRAAKVGRNIKRNTSVYIPEHFIPSFKPAKEFMSAVRDASPQTAGHPAPETAES